MTEYPIHPVPKPRMTKRDKWKKRPAVERYFAFKDEVRLWDVQIQCPCKITFFMPMPKSWSKKKRLAMYGQPHTVKPDWDNLGKAISDAVYGDDAHLWSVWVEKRWACLGSIKVEPL